MLRAPTASDGQEDDRILGEQISLGEPVGTPGLGPTVYQSIADGRHAQKWQVVCAHAHEEIRKVEPWDCRSAMRVAQSGMSL